MIPVDLLIQPKALIPSFHATPRASAPASCHFDWGIVINQGHITAVDSLTTLRAAYQPEQVLDLPNHLIMPGLVNAQSHALSIAARGQAAQTNVFAAPLNPQEHPASGMAGQPPSPDELIAAAQLAFAEMLLAGTTTCADMSAYPEHVAKAAEITGIRAQIGVPITEQSNPWATSAQDALERALALHDKYARNPNISVALGLPDLAQISAEILTKVGMYAEELNLQVQALLHPTPGHVLAIEERHGCDGVKLLDSAGLLGPALQAVHVNVVDDDAIDLLQRYRVALVRCQHPFSGQMRPWDWMQPDQPIGLGTGSHELNYYADAFHSAGQQGAQGLHRATQGSAEVMGLEGHIGSLEVDKLADVIALDLRVLDPRTDSDRVQVNVPSLLTRGRANQAVTHVWVGGSLHIDNRELR